MRQVPVKMGMFLRPPGYEFVVVRISSFQLHVVHVVHVVPGVGVDHQTISNISNTFCGCGLGLGKSVGVPKVTLGERTRRGNQINPNLNPNCLCESMPSCSLAAQLRIILQLCATISRDALCKVKCEPDEAVLVHV